MAQVEKADGAFRTIGELSAELDIPQHILRYWETRFPQLRPLQRAGKRRYYRPADVDLVRRIHRLLGQEGYTIKGVQKLLASKKPVSALVAELPAPAVEPELRAPEPLVETAVISAVASLATIRAQLADIRNRLASALDRDAA